MVSDHMDKAKPFSFLKGYSFSFEDDGNQIDAWFSAYSGLEKVFVNGQLVSKQRNLSTDSTSTFKLGNHEYSINLNAKSLLKGPFICTLTKDGENYKRQKLVFPLNEERKGKHSIALRFLFFIILGVIFGVLISLWQLPKEVSIYALGSLFLVVFLHNLKTSKARRPVIEDENVV